MHSDRLSPSVLDNEYKILLIKSTDVTLIKVTPGSPILSLITKPTETYSFKDISGEIRFNGVKVELDDLLRELRLKNAADEIGKLYWSTLKDGSYIGGHGADLCRFFLKNEENFLMLQECLSDDGSERFLLPKYNADKEVLLSHLQEVNPRLAKLIEDQAYHQDDVKPRGKKMPQS